MFNSQFRPPLFPNANQFGNIGTVSNFNQFGPQFSAGVMPFGSAQSAPAPPPFSFPNQSGIGNQSPASNAGSGTFNLKESDRASPSHLEGGSPTGSSSVRRYQQVQHHVQQVPVIRTVQVQERIIEIPQVHVVKEYVPKIEVIERVKEVPKIEIQVVEKIVEVPQIQYVDRYVDKIETREIERFVPKIEVVEVIREVPKVEYQYVEKIVEVPQIHYIDRIVEVPQQREVIKHVSKVEIVEIPIKREVKVAKIEKRVIEDIQEILVPEIIEVPVEKEVRVNVPVPQIQRIERPVPGPVNIVDVEVEVKVPKHVQVPHYIDVPVPREVIKEVLVPRQVPRYKDIEVPVEVEQIVTVPVERKVPVPRTVYKHVEEVKRVEVPYEVTVPQEVEEIVEIIQQVQPVIEPIFQTRYEKLPPIREKGKPVYMNGGAAPSGSGAAGTSRPPLPPACSLAPFNKQQLQQSNNTFASQATPVMAPMIPLNSFLPVPAMRSSPLSTSINLVRTAQARPDSPTPADVTAIDIADDEEEEDVEIRNQLDMNDQENNDPEPELLDTDKTLHGEDQTSENRMIISENIAAF